MHLAYRLFSLLCSAHFAVCVLLLSLGYRAQFSSVSTSVAEDRCNTNNITAASVQVVGVSLTGAYFLACMGSSAFSMLYLVAVEEEEGDARRLVEVLFWCYLGVQTYASLACLTLRLAPPEQLYLRWVLHVGAIYLVCYRTAQDVSSSLGALIFLGGAYWSVLAACQSQPLQVLSCLHRFVEFVLLWGHRWDKEPSAEVLLNCRLFFTACTGLLLHLDVLFVGS
jgi:hypothetical protein